MSILVKNNIHWVGQRDWEVRDFHGTEYKTLRGSSYNSYLIREEKNVLIDTVDHKFSREFVQNLRAKSTSPISTTSLLTTRKRTMPAR
jgi:anaerobic nitric oxide reductase flavorubredoxin